jgi:hypothetical protein
MRRTIVSLIRGKKPLFDPNNKNHSLVLIVILLSFRVNLMKFLKKNLLNALHLKQQQNGIHFTALNWSSGWVKWFIGIWNLG